MWNLLGIKAHALGVASHIKLPYKWLSNMYSLSTILRGLTIGAINRVSHLPYNVNNIQSSYSALLIGHPTEYDSSKSGTVRPLMHGITLAISCS